MKAADYKKLKIDLFAKTKDIRQYDKETGNFYKSIVIMSKRADQIASDLKQEFQESSQQYSPTNESLEEVYENREQIELSKFYEQLPKPTQIALYEFENNQVYFKDPDVD
ncbi:MAG: DNA-directed RNA polymerase subunit omega [Bacteroidales bacterium]|jgi:DNA-directed RNA polymerase subunit K/omega|nr:DNA-directed RNA polymerase subunit omega [Bacteroidales bacterium]MBR4787381.1 DNA-directed RNA polymerase subunit omega [Bacteroidales bacterium]MBR6161237.1 DNA-directed RNA polymerase subunit omega [Bacteroidales bacterium]MCR4737282.1 DNA-directed RNA polymerase subunit omega [Bacteroidales bacterium]